MENFRTWLSAVGRVLHLHTQRPDRDGGTVVELEESAYAAAQAPAATSQNELARFSALFSKLPEEQRNLLRLVVLAGFSYREAAERLGLEENEVLAHLSHARRKLRETAPSQAT